MSSSGPNSKAIPPDLKDFDRNREVQPSTDNGGFFRNCRPLPAFAAAVSHPPASSNTYIQSMKAKHTDLKNSKANSNISDREVFFSPVSEIGKLTDHCEIEPTIKTAVPRPSHSSNTNDHTKDYTEGFTDHSESFHATDALNPFTQCSFDNTQPGLKNSPLNSARTDLDLRCPSDKLHTEFTNSGNTNSNHQLLDNSDFVSTMNTDSINGVSNLTRKLENAKLISPAPLNTENPVQYLNKRKNSCSNWIKLDVKQKVRLVNKLGASKIRMALKKSIWIKRVKNLARKKHLNLDNFQKRNKTINLDVEKLIDAEENQLKEASEDTNDKKKAEKNIVDAKEKKEEGKTETQVPMSYADKVGKKRQMANLFLVIKKDPKLKVGEVEMPIADILKGSEPYSTTIYGYFIEKRVNYFNMNKYAMSNDGRNPLVVNNGLSSKEFINP
ncbi:hypothetical protein LXL04_014869 [Taraxacum kok-saghyz]